MRINVSRFYVVVEVKRTLTVGSSHDFSLLPRRLDGSPNAEQLSDLQSAAILLGLSEFFKLGDRIEPCMSRVTVPRPSLT